MNDSAPKISPLRQRMIEEMRLRQLAPKTREAYIRAVLHFTQDLRRSPDTATAEELRDYQLHSSTSGPGHARALGQASDESLTTVDVRERQLTRSGDQIQLERSLFDRAFERLANESLVRHTTLTCRTLDRAQQFTG